MLIFSTLLLVLCSNFLLTSPLLQVVTAIRNMALQHMKFQSQLNDAKKLWLYSQSPVSKHQALDDSLAKAKSRSKHWEREAKADAEKIKGVVKEMEEAKQEAKIS